MGLRDSFNVFLGKMSKRSPELLIGFGITGMALAIPFTVIGTIKAQKLVEEEKRRRTDYKELSTNGTMPSRQLTKKELIKTTWKCYIPTAISFISGAICVIGSDSIHNKRNAALATAYSLSENALRAYQDKVIETVGEKKEKAIRDEIAKDTIEKNPVTNKEVIITGKGETLCYDVVSGRYFNCDIEKIRKTENLLNKNLYATMFVSLSEFYYEIGLRATSISDELGWNIDDGPISFDFSTQLAEDERPCLVIGYSVAPRRDYLR